MMNNNEAGQPAAFAGKMMFFGGTLSEKRNFFTTSITTHFHDLRVLHQFPAGNSSFNMGPWHFLNGSLRNLSTDT